MRSLRFYTPQPLEPGAELMLEAALGRRLSQVLRLKADAQIGLFNGDGRDYTASILDIRPHHCLVQLGTASALEPQPRLDIHLGIGISKGDRMDLALQKATELGVGHISPLLCQHQALRLDRERLAKRYDHWRSILISASEQSGRCRLPGLEPAQPLCAWISQDSQSVCLLLDPAAGHCLDEIKPPLPGQELRLLIGPEGGLSQQEITQALGLGFQAVRLGPRILRTETAPLAALAAMQMLWGDFSLQYRP